MNRYAGLALNWSAVFLLVMAVLVNSPMLFYMATAIIVTIGAARLQAWLAVRYLRFERHAPPAVRVGEPVTIEIVIWSERELKRPLVTVEDQLPSRLKVRDRTQSLAVAPSFDQPIRTKYSFVPTRRGRYRWERLTVSGTDAIGLVTLKKSYHVEPCELVVYPAPLPVNEELRPLLGWGASDLDSGRMQGAGLEPRGVREFVSGDPIRYIHWRSTARRGKVMVKEFETGSGVSLNMVLQRTRGSDIGGEETSTFEAMCGHALYLASDYAKKGATVMFPLVEPAEAAREHSEARERSVRELLTDMIPDKNESVTAELESLRPVLTEGSTMVLFLSVQDPRLPEILPTFHGVQFVCLLYDYHEYVPAQTWAVSSPRACEPEYIDRLERAGAHTVTLARQEKVHA